VTTDGTTQTRTANQQNEITSISGAGSVTYDANGNTTADGSGNTFVYDAWNRLVAVKIGGTTLAAYGYNGLGERVTETHGTTTTDLYYSSSWQVLEERVSGVIQARNVWSPVYVDALVLRDQSSLHNGTLDQRLYVQQDADWNVTALVDASGNVVERYVYDPYGAVTVWTPSWMARGTSLYGWTYFFQGKRRDWAVGLDDSRGRPYSPTLMRWLQSDPLGFAAGDANLYRVEGNRPTNAGDPTGLEILLYPTTALGHHHTIVWYDRANDRIATYEGGGPGCGGWGWGTPQKYRSPTPPNVVFKGMGDPDLSPKFGQNSYHEIGILVPTGMTADEEYYALEKAYNDTKSLCE
jgi:RHS repeat-associated protein